MRRYSLPTLEALNLRNACAYSNGGRHDRYRNSLAAELVGMGGHTVIGPGSSADEALVLAGAELPQLAFVDVDAGYRPA